MKYTAFTVFILLLFSSFTFAADSNTKGGTSSLEEPVPAQIFRNMSKTIQDSERYDRELKAYKKALAEEKSKTK